ncbi:MAG: peroxidase family protein [Verrucomicrobiales bacterium]|nr:peroxidase family protein [Verrucomicrobiales bacterium]
MILLSLTIHPHVSGDQPSNRHLEWHNQKVEARVNKPSFSKGKGNHSKRIDFDRGQFPPFSYWPGEYRSIDGTGNNRKNPGYGAAFEELLRLVPAEYEDGLSTPSGSSRPSARVVSNTVAVQQELVPNEKGASDFLWQWGQFIDHDLDLTEGAKDPDPFHIEVPGDDPHFIVDIPLQRSISKTDSAGVRQQINEINSFIDASNVYGSDEERALALRTLDGTGKLRTTDTEYGEFLPFNEDGLPNAGGPHSSLFLAGDVRANEQINLTVMHTLFVREHNYWAEYIGKRRRNLSGDQIYEMARSLVAAEVQSITYNEFLPVLLGKNAIPRYRRYNPKINPGISNVFATAAFRVGHTMIPTELLRIGQDGKTIPEGNLALRDAFFNPALLEAGGLEPLLRGMAKQRAQRIDNQIVDDLRNFLFGPPEAGGFDLASLNIQRGRDHGIANYNTVREYFGTGALSDFHQYRSEEPETAEKLRELYGSIDNIDPWVGLLGEAHARDALVGETLKAVLVDQYTRLRDGDRFWYQNYMPRPIQNFVEKQTLSVIIKRNTDIDRIQSDVFTVPRSRPKYTGYSSGHPYYITGRKTGNRKADLRIRSEISGHSFGMEVKLKDRRSRLRNSDITVQNGYVKAISQLGGNNYYVMILANGAGPVSLELLGNRLSGIGQF